MDGQIRRKLRMAKWRGDESRAPLCFCVSVSLCLQTHFSKHNLRGELYLTLRTGLRLECSARDRRERTACRTLVR